MNNELKKSEFLGTEDVKKLLLKLSLPAIIGMGSNALYNLVDTIFVGRGVGSLGIGALSLVFPIQILIGAFALFFGVGGASIMSIKLGQGKTEEARKISGTSYAFAEITALILIIIGYTFITPLVQFLGATPSLTPYTIEYLKIMLIGSVPLSFAMVTNNQMRSQGSAKAAMNTMLFGTVINIILDPIFIFGLHWGVKGAAIATVISQFFSAGLALYYLIKAEHSLQLQLSSFIPHLSLFPSIANIGMATLIRQLGLSFVGIAVNISLSRFGGDLAIAAYGMVNRLVTFFTLPILGIAQGMQPLVGYNYGAHKFARMKEGIKYSINASLVLSAIAMILCIVFPRLLISMFTSDEALIQIAIGASRIIFALFFCSGLQSIGSTYFQAIGKGGEAMLLSFSRQFIPFLPLVIFLPRLFDLQGIWLAFPISDAFSGILSLTVMLLSLKKLFKVADNERKE